jgi:molybdopterin/thiamine biosynthesis adenylyltransferase
MWVPGMGEDGQRKLKAASVLISRVGGLGGLVALNWQRRVWAGSCWRMAGSCSRRI